MYRCKLEQYRMEVMALIMATSTSFGLSIGSLMATMFTDQLLLATLLSCGISALLGLMLGGFYGVFTQIEGVFTGIMAGMMGSMLVVMLPPIEGLFLLRMCLLLLTGTTMFSVMMLLKRNSPRFQTKHELLFLTTACLLMVMIFIMFPEQSIPEQDHHFH